MQGVCDTKVCREGNSERKAEACVRHAALFPRIKRFSLCCKDFPSFLPFHSFFVDMTAPVSLLVHRSYCCPVLCILDLHSGKSSPLPLLFCFFSSLSLLHTACMHSLANSSRFSKSQIVCLLSLRCSCHHFHQSFICPRFCLFPP